MESTIYDHIGTTYEANRGSDPVISSEIARSLGASESVINVGAGTGSYEPVGRFVLAVEPSIEMIKQRDDRAAPVVQGRAEALPVASKSFDAALAVLTIHHWSDVAAGLTELARVAQDRAVILTWDSSVTSFWLYDYFPEILEIDVSIFPSIIDIERSLGNVQAATIPIGHACADGFLGAYWRRPEQYLDSRIRSGMSTFSKLNDTASGVRQLESDLNDGTWLRKHGHLLRKRTLDLGYRLLVCDI